MDPIMKAYKGRLWTHTKKECVTCRWYGQEAFTEEYLNIGYDL